MRAAHCQHLGSFDPWQWVPSCVIFVCESRILLAVHGQKTLLARDELALQPNCIVHRDMDNTVDAPDAKSVATTVKAMSAYHLIHGRQSSPTLTSRAWLAHAESFSLSRVRRLLTGCRLSCTHTWRLQSGS
jgi:hypothetical protein